MTLTFRALIQQNPPMDAAYIEVPYDIKALTGKGRWLVSATFDGEPYNGQVVKMGLPCWIIGIPKAVRAKINKSFGDEIEVVLTDRKE